MPTFKITSPDGKAFNVTGNDAQGALAALQQHLGDTSAAQGSGPKTPGNFFDQFDTASPPKAQANVFDQFDPIVAQSADGVHHQFPAGTDPSVIDKVMKDYATSQTPAANPDVAVPWYTPFTSLQGNASDAVVSLYNAARHPIDTANGVGNLVDGAIRNGANYILPQSMQLSDPTPDQVSRFNAAAKAASPLPDWLRTVLPDAQLQGNNQAIASATGQQIKDNFSSPTRAWNTIATHPIDTLLTVAPGIGQAGKLADAAGMTKTASLLGNLSEVTNPVNVATKPLSLMSESVSGSRAIKSLLANAPDAQTVADTKNALYGKLNASDIKFDANGYQQTLADIADGLKNFRPAKAPLTSDTVDNLAQHAGKSPTFQDMEGMLQDAKGILREPLASNTDKAAAHVVIDHLSNFFDNSALSTNGLIPAGDVPVIAAQARDFARRDILGKQVTEMERKADFYKSGFDSGMSNQAASMGRRQGKGLTDLENEMLQKVARKEGLADVISKTGNGLASHIIPAITGAFGSAFGGVIGGAAGYGAGHVINMSAGNMAKKAALASSDRLMKTILAGKDAQRLAVAARKPISGLKGISTNARNSLLGGQTLSLLGNDNSGQQRLAQMLLGGRLLQGAGAQ